MTQFLDSLGWALLHSFWQGSLALLAVILFRSALKKATPSMRYNFQILCLFGCFAAFLVTFGLYQSGGEAPISFNLSGSETVSQAAALLTGSVDNFQAGPDGISLSAAASAPLLGLLWCLGFIFMALMAYASNSLNGHYLELPAVIFCFVSMVLSFLFGMASFACLKDVCSRITENNYVEDNE